MLLDFRENSICVLVEKSERTEIFLPDIKELLIGRLLDKCNGQETADPFRFNIAYFDREPCFWQDQVTKCTSETAHNAAQWIRSWTSSSVHSSLIGPRATSAIVAAFNDPFVAAVCLIAASLPFETAKDLLKCVTYASKDRPVHVIFLVAGCSVDERAMELLHLISRRTGGTFRLAYREGDGSKKGRLIEVPAIRKHYSRSVAARGDEESPAISPMSASTSSIEGSNFQISRALPHHSQFVQKSPGAESFSDLVIKPSNWPHDRTKSLVFSTKTDTRISSPTPLPRFLRQNIAGVEKEKIFQLESTIHATPENSVLDPEMNDIKKQFVEFYWKKRHKPEQIDDTKSYDRIQTSNSKMVEFEDITVEHNPLISPHSPASSRSHSNYHDHDQGKRDDETERVSARNTSPEIGTVSTVYDSPPSENRHSPSSRLVTDPIPVVIAPKSHYSPVASMNFSSPYARQSPMTSSRFSVSPTKPPWQPPTARSRVATASNIRSGIEDRSRAWMNRWWNEWVKRHEPKVGLEKTHASVQADPTELNTVPSLQRSKSEPRKLQVTTYTQTLRNEKPIGEEIQTIRELLVRNNTLLDSLNKSTTSTDYHESKASTRRTVQPPNAEDVRLQLPEAGKAASEIASNANSCYKSRQEQVQSAMERKEEIRRQQQEARYKAMYDKLAEDLTRRSAGGRSVHPTTTRVMTNAGETVELIARIPSKKL